MVRGMQRYRCHECGCNFVEGDRRVNDSAAPKKALALLLYTLCKASYRMLGRILGVAPSQVSEWMRQEAKALPEPTVSHDIKEMEFDEMWHFIGSKKTKFGSSKRWIAAHGELWPGCSAVVMLQPFEDSMTK